MSFKVIACVIALAASQAASAPWVGQVRSWVTANRDPIKRELVELLSIPNVAADRPAIRRNAEHLRAMLGKRGFAAELLETTGNPLVYGELKSPGASRTLLLYCHYDGQPVDPERLAATRSLRPCRAGRTSVRAVRVR